MNARTILSASAFIALLPLLAAADEYKKSPMPSGPKVAWIAMYLNAKSTDPRLETMRGYTPARVEVHVGDHIVFTNVDDEIHTATLRSHENFPPNAIKAAGHNLSDAWSTGNIKPNGESAPFLADKPGTYTYGCVHHVDEGQRGVIVVEP